MEVLNEKIREAGPVCWYEDAIAIDVADLRSRINRMDFGVTAFDPATGCRPNSEMNEDGTVKAEARP